LTSIDGTSGAAATVTPIGGTPRDGDAAAAFARVRSESAAAGSAITMLSAVDGWNAQKFDVRLREEWTVFGDRRQKSEV
jgi:hypothetical protein